MGNLAFQDVDFLLSDIQRSTPNREFLGLQSVQEPTKAVQFIGWVGVVHKPMIGGWPLFDQTATRARSRADREDYGSATKTGILTFCPPLVSRIRGGPRQSRY